MGSGRSRSLCLPRSRSSPIRHRLLRRQTRTIESPSTCIARESSSLCQPVSFSLCILLILHWLSVSGDWHPCSSGRCCPYRRVCQSITPRHTLRYGRCCPYRRVCRGVMLCVALNTSGVCTCVGVSGLV